MTSLRKDYVTFRVCCDNPYTKPHSCANHEDHASVCFDTIRPRMGTR